MSKYQISDRQYILVTSIFKPEMTINGPGVATLSIAAPEQGQLTFALSFAEKLFLRKGSVYITPGESPFSRYVTSNKSKQTQSV